MKIIIKSLFSVLLVILALQCKTKKPNETGTFTDLRDGYEYKWVKIGNQIWMAENLNFLPSVNTPSDKSYTEPYYYVYDNKDTILTKPEIKANYNNFGVLYNWPAAMEACPDGWHLPSDEEWKQMEIYLGMSQEAANFEGPMRGTDEGSQLADNTMWVDGVLRENAAFASSGFTALPGGILRSIDGYLYLYEIGGWWTYTESRPNFAFCRNVSYASSGIDRGTLEKTIGLSVRCIKDEPNQ